jgi:hypothetical protein
MAKGKNLGLKTIVVVGAGTVLGLTFWEIGKYIYRKYIRTSISVNQSVNP